VDEGIVGTVNDWDLKQIKIMVPYANGYGGFIEVKSKSIANDADHHG